jgi:excinuclease ABC subunit A
LKRRYISIKGARVHNLRHVDVDLPRDSLVVVTGPSGSGKSSLAFDTLYAEGQRRYVESLSSFAHQFLDQLPKPEVDRIDGLSPALAIDQKGLGSNPRSTVGTITEISNFLRLLYARCGTQTCPDCEVGVSSRPLSDIGREILSQPEGARIWLLAPVVIGRKGAHKKLLDNLKEQGHVRALIDGEMLELEEVGGLSPGARHDIAVVVDGLVNRPGVEKRVGDALTAAADISGGAIIMRVGNRNIHFSHSSSCPSCGRGFPELEPRLFSFNSPGGSCRNCQGLGRMPVILGETLVPDPELSLADGALAYLRGKETSWLFTQIEALADALDFSLKEPFSRLDPVARQAILEGLSPELDKSLATHRHYDAFLKEWTGLIPELLRRHRETKSEKVRGGIEKMMTPADCPVCNGYRLRPEALGVLVGDLHIGQVLDLDLTELLLWADKLSFGESIKATVAKPIIEQVLHRTRFLVDVGVGYLSLARSVASLSGGEGQRVRLATQVGSRLTGVLYVLDEPSIGLHHRDIHRLIETLRKLRDRGNSVIVVEHDLDIMLAADHLVDLGPGAGEFGGLITAQGTPEEVRADTQSLTGTYLADRGTRKQADPISGESLPENWLTISGLTGRNLKEIDLEFPLRKLTVVTGVSGSGKSTAVHDTIYRALARDLQGAQSEPGPYDTLSGADKLKSVVLVDQSPIGRSSRSTPATYSGLMNHIRKLFAATTLGRMRGYGAGRFSFNTGKGRCQTCEGAGVKRLTMDFLPDIDIPCEECGGRRYNDETLEVHFKGKSIADILGMTVSEAAQLLENIPPCRRILEVMDGVGLGYLRLGQAGSTLSGGEAQRLKLSRELSRGNKEGSLYILDEPTTGLHFCDVQRLLDILARLTERGHTVIVIEHNPEIIRRADWIIDLGPEGGREGGYLVACGSVDQVAATEQSYTGAMLRDLLAGI